MEKNQPIIKTSQKPSWRLLFPHCDFTGGCDSLPTPLPYLVLVRSTDPGQKPPAFSTVQLGLMGLSAAKIRWLSYTIRTIHTIAKLPWLSYSV